MDIPKDDIAQYAPKLTVTRHTGALLMWFQQTYVYRGEPEQIKKFVKSATIKNLIFGWWSVVSVFVNPAVTIGNWVEFSNYQKEYAKFITNPGHYIADAKLAEQQSQAKQQQNFKTALIVLGVVVVAVIVLLIVAFNGS